MYQPDHFRVDDLPQLHALMRARPFATLVSSGALGLYATHLPTVLKDDAPFGAIECHLSRANPHWQDLAAGNEALMVFQGPDAYVTPNWYPSKAEHGKVVPTWNYAVVHAYGRPEVIQDALCYAATLPSSRLSRRRVKRGHGRSQMRPMPTSTPWCAASSVVASSSRGSR